MNEQVQKITKKMAAHLEIVAVVLLAALLGAVYMARQQEQAFQPPPPPSDAVQEIEGSLPSDESEAVRAAFIEAPENIQADAQAYKAVQENMLDKAGLAAGR